jgi:hypothetical protein
MKRLILPLVLLCAACSTSTPPPVTVNATTGVATAGPANALPTNGNPLDFVVAKVGNDLSLDDANTINLAKSDPLGLTFANDVAALINAAQASSPAGSPSLGTLHIMSDQEQIRLQLIQLGTAGGQMALIQKTFNDGIAMLRDDEARGIQVAQGFRQFVAQIGAAAAGLQVTGAAAALAPTLP